MGTHNFASCGTIATRFGYLHKMHNEDKTETLINKNTDPCVVGLEFNYTVVLSAFHLALVYCTSIA